MKGESLKPIVAGQSGPEVEDVQQRLARLGYKIAAEELSASEFGDTTLDAVRSFRSESGLPAADEVDEAAWIALVDATYQMGDRTLYLRLPYFHGADVSHLQMALNVLGFSCGEVDGYYGPHTEAAVREFQANSGLYPDGMAFQDTFDAIERLHHVWLGQDAPTFSEARFGLSRAVDVLEGTRIVACGSDPISRNVVGRMWNVALATTNGANFTLVDSIDGPDSEYLANCDLALILTTAPVTKASQLPDGSIYVRANSLDELGPRVVSAMRASKGRPYYMRVELASMNSYDGSVTAHDVQSAAITLLDAICSSLDASGGR
jgi:peptidoglycan hydrolase-like protein with peptidoglycan-binding domain